MVQVLPYSAQLNATLPCAVARASAQAKRRVPSTILRWANALALLLLLIGTVADRFSATPHTAQHWKVFGPDLTGSFGAFNGTGGLEAVISHTGTIGAINDRFGNLVASVSANQTLAWSRSKLGSYGVLPNSESPTLEQGASLIEASAWRTRRTDPTGFINMGARHYEPTTGRFLSADPLGHSSSWNLYDFANGDAVNGFDADGRIATGFLKGAAFDPDNTPHSVAGDVGYNMGSGTGVVARVVGQTAKDVGTGILSLANPHTYVTGYQNLDRRVAGITAANSDMGMGPVQLSLAVPGVVLTEMLGINALVEGSNGYDLATGTPLNGWESAQRLAAGTAQLASAAAMVRAPVSAPAAKGGTSLFRAVGPAEFEQLMATKTFQAGPNSLGGKFFAESAEHATQWGTKMEGAGNFRVIEAQFPKGSADSFMRWDRLDGIGPARYGELGPVNAANPTILPWP